MKVKVSWLWIPFLLLCPLTGLTKTLCFIFLILSIHEAAHVLVAMCFHYPIHQIILYPFGLCAQIDGIGYRFGRKDFLILIAGPCTHLLQPFLLLCCMKAQWISQSFYDYLCMMNASILFFNMLPIYPLDGGRIMELCWQLLLPYKRANQCNHIMSMIVILAFCFLGMFQSMSGLFVCILLWIENMVAFHKMPYRKAVFYEYRLTHSIHYPIRMNTHQDLFRFAYNIMEYHHQWIKEEDWLRYTLKERR